MRERKKKKISTKITIHADKIHLTAEKEEHIKYQGTKLPRREEIFKGKPEEEIKEKPIKTMEMEIESTIKLTTLKQNNTILSPKGKEQDTHNNNNLTNTNNMINKESSKLIKMKKKQRQNQLKPVIYSTK